MSPDGMSLLNERWPVRLPAAEVTSAVMMEHHIFVQEDHGVAWVSTRERLTNNYVAGLSFRQFHPMEIIGLHIFEIQVLFPKPPSLRPLKIRQVDTAEMVRITKKGVAIHHPMLEPAAKQMRYCPELEQPAIRCQPPWQVSQHLRMTICT